MENQSNKNELIQLWNDTLSDEQAASVLYYQGANRFTLLYALTAAEIIEHGDEETGHAKLIREHLDYLGGYITTMTSEVKTAIDNIDILKLMYQSELVAINKYKNIIRFCRENGFYESEILALGILKDEVHHATYLKNLLDITGGL